MKGKTIHPFTGFALILHPHDWFIGWCHAYCDRRARVTGIWLCFSLFALCFDFE